MNEARPARPRWRRRGRADRTADRSGDRGPARAILAVNRAAMKVDGKTDGSPVTEADLAADRIIAEGLARLAPTSRRCRRSAPALAKPPYKASFFLIDPLDGTKEFVAGRNEFTVNLALVTDGTPLLGIVGAPALGLIWRGIVGRGAERLTLARRRRAARRADPHPALARRAASPGRSRSAARMAMPGPKPSLPSGPARSGPSSARRSNSAGSPKARSISIPACRRPANGTSRPAMRWSPPPAARSRIHRARRRAVRRGREGLYRAGIHRLGRSGRARHESTAPAFPASAGQRALASLRKRAGSAAKASRLSSRPNR